MPSALACNPQWPTGAQRCQPGKAKVRQAFQPDGHADAGVAAGGEPTHVAAELLECPARWLATRSIRRGHSAVSLERLTYHRLSSLTAMWMRAPRRVASRHTWLPSCLNAQRAGLQPAVAGGGAALSASLCRPTSGFPA